MEKPVKVRSVLRGQLSKKVKLFHANMAAQEEDDIKITTAYKAVKEIYQEIRKLDNNIMDLILEKEKEDSDKLNKDIEDAEKYKDMWFECETKYEAWKQQHNVVPVDSNAQVTQTHRMKYPKIEIPKFNGDISQWLPFWAQFGKIHNETALTAEEKFIYLLQAVTEGTEARQLVDSYPISANNYTKCIEHLKQRYAREDLQTL